MASAKIIAKPRPYADGTIGIYLQVISDRKPELRQVLRIPAGQWDFKRGQVKGRTAEAQKQNRQLEEIRGKARSYLLECQINGATPNIDAALTGTSTKDTISALLLARADRLEA